MWEPQGMYSKFVLKQPTILFGENALLGLKTYPMSRVAIIHGSTLSEDYKAKLAKAMSAYEIKFVQKDWGGEPTLQALSNVISRIEELRPDVIIAIGGGSVIDGAKMVRTYYEFPFFNIRETKFSLMSWKTTFIAIPTTIGSGAEISSSAVMYNDSLKSKEFIICHQFIPEIIVLDAVLIQDAPTKLLFSSMVDALAHCIEGYMSKVDNALIDVFAEKAIRIFAESYQLIGTTSIDEVLNRIQLASVFAGMVQNHCIVGATHAIAHQMTSFGLSHSDAIAIFLPNVIKKNIENPVAQKRFNNLAIHSGFPSGKALLSFVEKVISICDLKVEKEIVVKNKSKILSDHSFFERALNDKGGQGNPIEMSKEFLQEIFINSIL